VPSLGGPPAAVEETIGVAPRRPAAASYPMAPERPARGAILFVGDGMGLAHLAAARLATAGADGRLAIERFPVTGLLATHPAEGLVTKSDAAATAIATGHKTLNGRVGASADGRPLRTILEVARDQGFATALVTTSEIVDATPAAFGAHSADRGAAEDIASQLLSARIDVLMGAGAPWFLPSAHPPGRRRDGRDLLAEANAAGYTVARTAGELAAAPDGKLLGLFDFDLSGVEPTDPSLTEMTRKTLATLGKRPRFFAMIEQEGIDTRSHRNSVASMVAALAALDAAVELAADWANEDGAVLVVVTADHETGGLTLHDAPRGQLLASWASDYHSAVPVPVFAFGPQATRFTSLHDNTDLPGLLAAALEIPSPDGP
jgi:alkaline phosphatase